MRRARWRLYCASVRCWEFGVACTSEYKSLTEPGGLESLADLDDTTVALAGVTRQPPNGVSCTGKHKSLASVCCWGCGIPCKSESESESLAKLRDSETGTTVIVAGAMRRPPDGFPCTSKRESLAEFGDSETGTTVTVAEATRWAPKDLSIGTPAWVPMN